MCHPQTTVYCNHVSNLLLSGASSPLAASSVDDHLLTQTEKNILKEIVLGKTTKEIATEKNLSFHTINSHRKNIFRKLGVNNVHEATKYAMRAGIVDLAEYTSEMPLYKNYPTHPISTN